MCFINKKEVAEVKQIIVDTVVIARPLGNALCIDIDSYLLPIPNILRLRLPVCVMPLNYIE